MNEVSISVYISITVFNILLFYILAAMMRINILYIIPLFIVIQSLASILFAVYYEGSSSNELPDGTNGNGVKYITDSGWTSVEPGPHGRTLLVTAFNNPGDGEIFMNGAQIIMNSNTVGLETFNIKDVLYFVNGSDVQSFAITSKSVDLNNNTTLGYVIYTDTC